MEDEPAGENYKEKRIQVVGGCCAVLGAFILLILSVICFILAGISQDRYNGLPNMGYLFALGPILFVAFIILMSGVMVIQPNYAWVCQFCGKYVGTVRNTGLWWVNPFYSKFAMSLRINNFETSRIKVNDANGSPIEIQCVVVWRIHDTAEASFEVENYQAYLRIQSEAALRNATSQYPYEATREGDIGLRSNPTEISATLRKEIGDRLDKAGIQIIEAKISHLAYSPEIAQAMLRKQQAQAVIAARSQIVTGAVSMVQMALQSLEEQNVVQMSADKKASMVSNLLVVLCGEEKATPVINTGGF